MVKLKPVSLLFLLCGYTVSSLLRSADDRDIGKAVLLVAREMLKLKPVWLRFWYLNFWLDLLEILVFGTLNLLEVLNLVVCGIFCLKFWYSVL